VGAHRLLVHSHRRVEYRDPGSRRRDDAFQGSETDVFTGTIVSLEGLLLVRILEVGLLAVAVFHMLNGTRLLLVDLGVGLEAQDKSFYASLILTGAITVASIPTFIAGAF